MTIGVVCVLFLGGGYWGYKHFTAKPAVATNITAKAKMGNVKKVITATGTVNFSHLIPLQFSNNGQVVNGQVVELNIKDGDLVKKGQVLARIDDTDLKTAVVQQQANLKTAQTKLQSIREGYNAQTLATAQSALAKAQQSLIIAQQNADPAYLLAGATILAPTDAVVINCGLQLYQYTTNNSIITITPTDGTESNLEVAASIDQADIAQVEIGQKVDITLDAYPDEHSSGTVSLVALQGTTTSNVTTFKVTVAVEKASNKLRSGMNANIDIVVAEADNVLTVPSEAIKTVDSNKIVLVPITITTSGKDRTGQAGQAGQAVQDQAALSGTRGTASSGKGVQNVNTRPVTVEVGLDDGTNVEIKSGLTEGQEVVTGTRTTTSTTTTPRATSGFSLGGGGNRAISGGARPGQ